jgi:hypothetical protein
MPFPPHCVCLTVAVREPRCPVHNPAETGEGVRDTLIDCMTSEGIHGDVAAAAADLILSDESGLTVMAPSRQQRRANLGSSPCGDPTCQCPDPCDSMDCECPE